ncbi:caspase activity and apoptosis inhibitor 1 [Thalassophryne amazonica]|uniref:caspase activity and apoptosis inhibitor 1 n=1 Tax=Thalassophryne amazonica TaxID=390379 RepID=UPI0014725165|nr:caspase activity and apoptosis inhibitor 1 [Thalassophryne amazonica]
MLKKKSTSEKKRKQSQAEERHDGVKRRSTESNLEQHSKDELADPELDRIGSDIEEGGLDLTLPLKPIAAYVTDKKQMLEQCFRVLGERKLQKMLPDELKSCSLEEIKHLCQQQLQQISEKNLTLILAGDDLMSENGDENTEQTSESQQDNNVDSTSCLKDTAKTEESKQEGGGSGEESDVLSINADTYDSDIEGPKEQTVKVVGGALKSFNASRRPTANPKPSIGPQPVATKKDIQSDIDKSVSEILAFSPPASARGSEEQIAPSQSAAVQPAQGAAAPTHPLGVCQPSVQQLELLELEMRARAIKALMKANEGKKICVVKNVAC